MSRFFPSAKRSLDSLLNLITDLVVDGLLFFRLLFRSRTALQLESNNYGVFLSDNELHIKVKRMVYLSGWSDFKTRRNNCAAHGPRRRSKCASQYVSQMTSVWRLRKNQYKTFPNIKAAQMKDSIMALHLNERKKLAQ